MHWQSFCVSRIVPDKLLKRGSLQVYQVAILFQEQADPVWQHCAACRLSSAGVIVLQHPLRAIQVDCLLWFQAGCPRATRASEYPPIFCRLLKWHPATSWGRSKVSTVAPSKRPCPSNLSLSWNIATMPPRHPGEHRVTEKMSWPNTPQKNLPIKHQTSGRYDWMSRRWAPMIVINGVK